MGDDLRIRGASAVWHAVADFDEVQLHDSVLSAAREKLGGLDVVLIAYGVLPDQLACVTSARLTVSQFETNALSQIALSIEAARHLASAGGGVLAVISSVAGDRARKSNYTYGSAKAALSAFLSGLRMQLTGTSVQVLTIKPGLVDTPMTAHLAKGRLWTSAERVARDIVEAIDARRAVLYTPAYWRWVMLAVRHLPERLLARLKI
jgi:hypothetical protein